MTASLDLFGREPLQPSERWRVDCNDACKWLGGMGTSSAELMVTDPAYRSLDAHRESGSTPRLQGEWFETVPDDYFWPMLGEAWRVLARDAHAYVFCDWTTALAITPMAKAVGFTVWTPIVWDKLAMGMGYHYRSRYELILFLEKGKRKLHDLGVPNVISSKRLSSSRAGEKPYPTEKPTDVLEILIRQSSSADGIVIDPMCGSGSTGEAALTLERRFAGCDIKPSAVERARIRLGGI